MNLRATRLRRVLQTRRRQFGGDRNRQVIRQRQCQRLTLLDLNAIAHQHVIDGPSRAPGRKHNLMLFEGTP